ncbi:MAG: DinB superfamily protein [Blastocatellia bacterium]
MLNDILIEIFSRDLATLRKEIELYEDEQDLWTLSGNISNPAGNLALHIAGNLRHFLGAVLGGDGYVRNRDAEFAARGVRREAIIAEIEAAADCIKSVIPNLTSEDFTRLYPIEVFGRPMTTAFFLTHLATHLNYHLGQINYHRRLLSKPRV